MNSYTLHPDDLDAYTEQVNDIIELYDVQTLIETLEHHERVVESVRDEIGYRTSSAGNPYDKAIGDALAVTASFGHLAEDEANETLDALRTLLNIAREREEQLR